MKTENEVAVQTKVQTFSGGRGTMEEFLWGGLLVLMNVTLYWNILKSFCMFRVYNRTSNYYRGNRKHDQSIRRQKMGKVGSHKNRIKTKSKE